MPNVIGWFLVLWLQMNTMYPNISKNCYRPNRLCTWIKWTPLHRKLQGHMFDSCLMDAVLQLYRSKINKWNTLEEPTLIYVQKRFTCKLELALKRRVKKTASGHLRWRWQPWQWHWHFVLKCAEFQYPKSVRKFANNCIIGRHKLIYTNGDISQVFG